MWCRKVKYIFYVLGILLLTLGISFTIQSDFGTSPFDAVLQGLSIRVGLTVGSWVIIALILICCNSFLIRQRPDVLGLLTAAITGIGIDRTGFFFNFKEGELTIVVLNINKHVVNYNRDETVNFFYI